MARARFAAAMVFSLVYVQGVAQRDSLSESSQNGLDGRGYLDSLSRQMPGMAVTRITADQFNRGNIHHVLQLIQGKVAGVSIVKAGGDPNRDFEIRIRGITTLGYGSAGTGIRSTNENANPLYVIDGVPAVSLANIDPLEVESITVLKDGASAALYGARGSNGVLIINTKRARQTGDYHHASYEGFLAVDQVSNLLPVLSAEEFVQRGGLNFNSNTRWTDEILRTGFSQAHGLGLEGRTGQTDYRIGVQYRDVEGIARNSGFQRLATHLGVHHNMLRDKLRLSLEIMVSNREETNPTRPWSSGSSIFEQGLVYNPTAPVYESNPATGGFFQRSFFAFYNPVAMLAQQEFEATRNNSLVNFTAAYDLLRNLSATVQYGSEQLMQSTGDFYAIEDPVRGQFGNGLASRSLDERANRFLEAMLHYRINFRDWKMKAWGGYANQVSSIEGFSASVTQFLYNQPGFHGLDFGANRTSVNSYRTDDQLVSWQAGAEIIWKNIYSLTLLGRTDSYSGFGANENAGFFPALGVGIDLDQLAGKTPSDWRLRFSYGRTGLLPVDPLLGIRTFLPLPTTQPDGSVVVNIVPTRDSNPTLKWEEKRELNLGFDFSFFKNRFLASVDYYKRTMDDLIYFANTQVGEQNIFLPEESSIGLVYANLGSLNSWGWEFQVSYRDAHLGSVRWNSTLVATGYKRARVESLSKNGVGQRELTAGGQGSVGCCGPQIFRIKPGEELGEMYAPWYTGLDGNGQMQVSTDDWDKYEVVGNGLPQWELGFTNQFTWRNWDLNFLFRGAFGHSLYNNFRRTYEVNYTTVVPWNSVTTPKNIGSTGFNHYASVFFERASFLRLDNITLSYHFPGMAKNYVRVKAYVTAQNLFTITSYAGMDPEVRYADSLEIFAPGSHQLTPGLDRMNQYYPSRTFQLGLQLFVR
ncbi:MAG TPA: hypothetical protein DCE81_00230 [Cytophagales bacterium]|nr:hypothetical protein [Cytophagales bacterium]